MVSILQSLSRTVHYSLAIALILFLGLHFGGDGFSFDRNFDHSNGILITATCLKKMGGWGVLTSAAQPGDLKFPFFLTKSTQQLL